MLRLVLKPSRQLSAWLLFGHIAAAVCVLIVAMSLWLQALIAMALLLNLIYTLTYQAWRRWPSSIIGLQFERDGMALLEYRNGAVCAARILDSSFVAPYLAIVLLKTDQRWGTNAVVILPDAVEPELFRQLRVWLKWGIGQGVEAEASAAWGGRL